MSLRVDDLDAAADEVLRIAGEAGGFLSGQQLDRTEDGATGSIVVEVPSDRFDEVLDQLSGLGDLLTRNVTTDDVTDQVVDLQARLATATASAERVRALLADATSVDEIVRLEAEVSARETVVEQLTGQLASAVEQVALSTITVLLGEELPPPPPSGDPEPSEDIPGFASGLRWGWVALVNAFGVVGTVAGVLLPFAVVLLPLTVAGWWWRRRVRHAAA